MSFSLYLLLPSEDSIERQYIATFIDDGSYFDTPPKFEPHLKGELGDLNIHFDDAGFVQFKKLTGEEAESAIAEAIGSLDSAPISVDHKRTLEDQINRTRSVIEVNVDRENMTKDSWAMLDALEADILKSNGGLLYVYDEGIYGPNLRLWPSAADR
jgi:hypothetical protein